MTRRPRACGHDPHPSSARRARPGDRRARGAAAADRRSSPRCCGRSSSPARRSGWRARPPARPRERPPSAPMPRLPPGACCRRGSNAGSSCAGRSPVRACRWRSRFPRSPGRGRLATVSARAGCRTRLADGGAAVGAGVGRARGARAAARSSSCSPRRSCSPPGLGRELADHAAEAGAVAVLQGADPEAAARAAVPGWSHGRLDVVVAAAPRPRAAAPACAAAGAGGDARVDRGGGRRSGVVIAVRRRSSCS